MAIIFLLQYFKEQLSKRKFVIQIFARIFFRPPKIIPLYSTVKEKKKIIIKKKKGKLFKNVNFKYLNVRLHWSRVRLPKLYTVLQQGKKAKIMNRRTLMKVFRWRPLTATWVRSCTAGTSG